jgi:hypothetical protein
MSNFYCTEKIKLWVFDSVSCLEVYAPTRAEAQARADTESVESGQEFVLSRNWKYHQNKESNK